MRQILGISYDNKGIEVILSTLNERILSQRSEINDLISGILEMNKIDIGDNEDFDISLAEDGSISVKAINDDALAEKRATVIQDAFNEESEDVIELKAKLKSMTLDEMALSELSAKQNLNGSTISDGLAVAFIENQLGASLESIRNEDGVLSEESDTIKELVSNSPNIISALNSSTEHKSTELYGNFTLSSEVIKSDFVEDYSRSMKKHVEDNLAHNAILYNDAGVYNENEIKDLPPGLDEYLGSKNATQEKGKISFDVSPELRIESFEARINEHG